MTWVYGGHGDHIDMEMWRPWRHGGMENMETCRHEDGGVEARRHGDLDTWGLGEMET